MRERSLASATHIITGTSEKMSSEQKWDNVRWCSSRCSRTYCTHTHANGDILPQSLSCFHKHIYAPIGRFKQSASLLAGNMCPVITLCCGRPRVSDAPSNTYTEYTVKLCAFSCQNIILLIQCTLFMKQASRWERARFYLHSESNLQTLCKQHTFFIFLLVQSH